MVNEAEVDVFLEFLSFFNYNAHDMLHTIERAVDYYRNHQDIWRRLQQKGMEGDYSWTHSANEYLKLYQRLFEPKVNPRKDEEKENPVVVDV